MRIRLYPSDEVLHIDPSDPPFLTKTQLKGRRLKLAPDQRPAARWWQGYDWIMLYDPAEAVPMRPYRAPTEAQRAALAAGRELLGTAPCKDCGTRREHDELSRGRCEVCWDALHERRAAREAAELLALDPLFLDTETTGLDGDAEVIEVAVIDVAGRVLLETLVKPVESVPAAATYVHGLTDADLAAAPAWPAVAGRLAELLRGRVVVAHNARFDRRMIAQSCRRHEVPAPEVAGWDCTMELLTELNGGQWPSLGVALAMARATPPEGESHRARHDTESCRRVVLALANQAQKAGSEPTAGV